jgi:hypothetical protein
LPKEKRYIEDLSKNTSIQIVRANPNATDLADLMCGF